MEDNTLTAKKFLTTNFYPSVYDENCHFDCSGYTEKDVTEAMIEFAKLHVEAMRQKMLEEIVLVGNCYWEGVIITEEKFKLTNDVYIDKNSILNAYLLDNIK